MLADKSKTAELASGAYCRLPLLEAARYRGRMATQDPETYFPELENEERSRADEWLRDYLRLVIRIHREHIEALSTELSTDTSLTEPVVLASSVQPSSQHTIESS